jgi:hypothetical protein
MKARYSLAEISQDAVRRWLIADEQICAFRQALQPSGVDEIGSTGCAF